MTQSLLQRSARAIYGCSGPVLTAEERAFVAAERPFGFILFARNIETPEQTKTLVADLRESVGWRAPVLIDQEGGRVARMRPPHWRGWPDVGDWAAAVDAAIAADPDAAETVEAALLTALHQRYRIIAAELVATGIDVNCAPLGDLRLPAADAVIGARALGADPAAVGRRAAAVADGLLAGGVLPVIKHLPGHGRAGVDSHLALPVVDTARDALAETDVAAFRPIAHHALGMTAHIVYPAIDAARCATHSAPVLAELVRGAIGFDGLLMSDDLSMGALASSEEGGGFADRARLSLAAGCDVVLHCNGDLAEMAAVASVTGPFQGESLRRAEAALAARPEEPAAIDRAEAEAALAATLCAIPGASDAAGGA